jgi:ATP-dependent Clp protease ATP-binding subunit ClpC
MFERYTEHARRVLFFARHETIRLGRDSIDADQLLLGILRGGEGLIERLLADAHVSIDDLRREIEGPAVIREAVPTSVEIPFTSAAKRVLQFAAEEADRLGHEHIGAEHLLLGLLREERSPAAVLLAGKGLTLDVLRPRIVQILGQPVRSRTRSRSMPCCFCNDTVPAAAFLLVAISRSDGSGGSQYLYAHPHCLRARVRADVPLVIDSGDEP